MLVKERVLWNFDIQVFNSVIMIFLGLRINVIVKCYVLKRKNVNFCFKLKVIVFKLFVLFFCFYTVKNYTT